MFEPTGSLRDAASTIFNLPDYRVVDAVYLPDGGRQIVVESMAPPGCPVCGVVSVRVHSRRRQVVRDVPVGGPVRVVWDKRRWFCEEVGCPRGTFSESTVQIPARARSTARLREALVAAVVVSGRAASETARAFAVSWWAVQAALSAVAARLPEVDDVPVRRLGPRPVGAAAHRPRLPQRGQLPHPYPARQRREDRSVNTLLSGHVHHKPRRAVIVSGHCPPTC